jgi:hypothetical protein
VQEKYTQTPTFSTSSALSTPVLFLTFNRPDTTQQVFSEIRKAQPTSLYVAGDGPRPEKSNEAEICEIVRSIITNVDWDCEVKTLFRDHNLGCRLAVSQAISWFFENEPEGIILEDDCLPSQSFFWFCQELLELFRNNQKVGAICGFYSNELDYTPDASYFFSRYLRVWGWAGWRRSFEGYDSNLKNLIENNNTWQTEMFSKKDVLLIKYFQQMFDQVAKGEIDTWDAQLQYLLWHKKQKVIVSSKNMIKNIGWIQGAHAQNKDHNHELPTSEIEFPLTSPEYVERDIKADKEIELKSYQITKLSFLKSQLRKLVP